MRIYYIAFVLLVSCNGKVKNDVSTEIQPKTIVILNKDDSTKVENIDESNWINSFPANIKSLKDSFYKIDVKKYSSAIIDQFYTNYGTRLNTNNLFQINDTICSGLFGDAQTEYGNFRDSYLYSIEKPIMRFYPITIIQYFGVVDRPVMLVLFDSAGNYVNSIEVANSFGEGGGGIESYLINDSTLIQKLIWDEYIIDSLGNDVFESSYRNQKVIFNISGDYTVEKLDN